MLSSVLVAIALQQNPVSVPAFQSWDGKSWAGISVGTSEKDLKQLVKTAKTVGPDPASIRVLVDKKGWILAAILTESNGKGSVAGFTLDLEKNDAIESLEALQQEIGAPDFSAYPRLRYSDWSLAVWKDKGIAAVLTSGNRPLVQKVLLAPPSVLAANLDLWDRDPNQIHDGRVPVTHFDISASSEPHDSRVEDDCVDAIRRGTRRAMDSDGGAGWRPVSGDGATIGITVQYRKGNLTELLSLSYRGELGDTSISESETATVRRDDAPDRSRSLFDDLMAKANKDISDKYKKLVWQAEWRPFTALTRPK